MHQHGGLGVPVRLGADVDAGDHDVDLTAALGELDDPLQRLCDPVHVLRAGLHRDPGAGGDREPLHRHAHRLGEVQSGDHPRALRLAEGAQRAQRIAAEQDAFTPSG